MGGNFCEAHRSIPKLTQLYRIRFLLSFVSSMPLGEREVPRTQVRHWSLDPTIVSFNATIETMKRAYEW